MALQIYATKRDCKCCWGKGGRLLYKFMLQREIVSAAGARVEDGLTNLRYKERL